MFFVLNWDCCGFSELYGVGCQHTCVNAAGSYSCSCYEGFELDTDGTSCVSTVNCSSDSLSACSQGCAKINGK